jgi:hypothetical protein
MERKIVVSDDISEELDVDRLLFFIELVIEPLREFTTFLGTF